jgi:PKD repeat protein
MRSIRLMAATTVILLGAWGCGDDNGGIEPGTDPVANFTAPACVAGTACTFTDASTDDGTITAWSWDFNGDATPDATTETASFTYATAGTFQVTLTVTDDDGNTDSHTAPVTVTGGIANVAPTAAFNVPTCTVNVACLFTDASTDPEDGTPSAWRWNFGDNTAEVTDQNPTHTYTTVGTFNVTLTVTDSQGATGTITQAVTVSPASSQACTTSGTFVDCTLTLTQRSTVTVTLTTNDCELGGNRVDVRDPSNARQVLFFNGCFLSEGSQFLVDDATGAPIVFEAGTSLVLQFRQGTGVPAPGAPAAQIEGTFPSWTMSIDDGGNPGGPGEPDFTDLVLSVQATPQ